LHERFVVLCVRRKAASGGEQDQHAVTGTPLVRDGRVLGEPGAQLLTQASGRTIADGRPPPETVLKSVPASADYMPGAAERGHPLAHGGTLPAAVGKEAVERMPVEHHLVEAAAVQL